MVAVPAPLGRFAQNVMALFVVPAGINLFAALIGETDTVPALAVKLPSAEE